MSAMATLDTEQRQLEQTREVLRVKGDEAFNKIQDLEKRFAAALQELALANQELEMQKKHSEVLLRKNDVLQRRIVVCEEGEQTLQKLEQNLLGRIQVLERQCDDLRKSQSEAISERARLQKEYVSLESRLTQIWEQKLTQQKEEEAVRHDKELLLQQKYREIAVLKTGHQSMSAFIDVVGSASYVTTTSVAFIAAFVWLPLAIGSFVGGSAIFFGSLFGRETAKQGTQARLADLRLVIEQLHRDLGKTPPDPALFNVDKRVGIS